VIRLASVAARFKHGGKSGFDLNRTWVEFKSLTSAQVKILRDRHGRWIRIHPDDREELAKFGLRFVGGQEPLEPVTEAELKAKAKADADAKAKAKAEADAKAKADADAAKAKADADAKNTTTTVTPNAKADKADEKKS
jgi:hypothetical protein